MVFCFFTNILWYTCVFHCFLYWSYLMIVLWLILLVWLVLMLYIGVGSFFFCECWSLTPVSCEIMVATNNIIQHYWCIQWCCCQWLMEILGFVQRNVGKMVHGCLVVFTAMVLFPCIFFETVERSSPIWHGWPCKALSQNTHEVGFRGGNIVLFWRPECMWSWLIPLGIHHADFVSQCSLKIGSYTVFGCTLCVIFARWFVIEPLV